MKAAMVRVLVVLGAVVGLLAAYAGPALALTGGSCQHCEPLVRRS
jgi:hypothetical protein